MDRRIQKTRDSIIDAFVGLMAEKDFEQITINEIAERANVNRGTIYLHYTDKYDLLDKCIETHLDQLFKSCLPDGDPADFSSKASILRTFEYLERNYFLYSTMLSNKGVPAFRNSLLAKAVHSLREQGDKIPVGKGMNKEILIQFAASGTVGLLEWWVTQSMPYPAETMVEEFWALLERFQLGIRDQGDA